MQICWTSVSTRLWITKRGTEGNEVLKRELNSFFRRRRSSETSGKSPAKKGHKTRRLLLLSLFSLVVGFLSRDFTANLAWNIHLARSHPRLEHGVSVSQSDYPLTLWKIGLKFDMNRSFHVILPTLPLNPARRICSGRIESLFVLYAMKDREGKNLL